MPSLKLSHSITHPLAQPDHRCPNCGAAWQLSLDKGHAVGWPKGVHTALDADAEGWFWCVCGGAQRFRWGE